MHWSEYNFRGQLYQVDLTNPLDISIPLRNGSKNPSCYNSKAPVFNPIVKGTFTGSVAEGGPCNHQQLTLAPHGNGTHTECFGHISDNPEFTINQCLRQFHFYAILVSIKPRPKQPGDMIISLQDLKDGLGSETPEALIIRSLPNDEQKLTRAYSGTNPVYLEQAAAAYLASSGISHLLVDLPSVDKEADGGKLLAHRAFWNFPESPRLDCTITELIFVPDTIPDGKYLLNLQITSLESDASPSKPVLYRIINKNKPI